jgi:hypothetical protein
MNRDNNRHLLTGSSLLSTHQRSEARLDKTASIWKCTHRNPCRSFGNRCKTNIDSHSSPHNYFLFLKSYILSRHFLVKVGTDQSALTSINAGVPQGSVLGPLLYLLYTADLPTSPGILTATFADDTSILTTDSDPVVASHFFKRTS